MPRLDPEMKEGVILEWLKREGDPVQKGDPIAKVEGEKVIFDVEAPESGILRKILANRGVSIPIAQPIAVIAGLDEEKFEIIEIPTEFPSEEIEKERMKISPAARKIAREHELDITEIRGTGPGGRILKKDVLKAIEEVTRKPEVMPLETKEIIPLVGMRKTIADRMNYSYRTIPQVTITMEVDMTEAIKLRQTIEKIKDTGISFTAISTKSTAHALRKYPILNSTLEKGQIRIFNDINIGIAVALEEGLIVPVVHYADNRSLSETALLIEELIEKAKERKLSVEELKGATFTITNLGGFGVGIFTPIIYPPQTAILGIGEIAEKPRVRKGRITIAPMMTLSLVFDHRVVDGAKAAQFLREIKELLEDPYALFAEFF